MNSLDIIKKHLTPEVPFVLKNENGTEDTIMLKPLDTAQQALSIELGNTLQSLKSKGEPINKDTAIMMFDLFKSIVKKSIIEIDEDTLDNFVSSNFEGLSEILEKLSPKVKDQKKIEEIKHRLEQIRERKNVK